ncbi:hypothetical protein DACRYDRAFT_84823 [Dacryopinax primogenitus]|uniref:Uncharacterized protein n=1 Tax=Dacryopinax primogenitus (strain DJM 731) TaxID=1858805 RepID=M5FVB6_DACPD|nr:uncharacterized protein DACRYDRAFT_84823 [Dacryopinax primogenitus]EJT97261.1 hypothetical protein DACRYDRAFT_84823 [Dacryopinax primogenitus]
MFLSPSVFSYVADGIHVEKLLNWVKASILILYLFTKADYHTLFFPIAMFALVAGPIQQPIHILTTAVWIWIHQLQCNINNQLVSISEDKDNKPWRPLPAGRITSPQAQQLHGVVTILCLLLSTIGGYKMVVASAALMFTCLLYDQGRGSAHWMERIPLVVLMYGIFEYGSTRVISKPLYPSLDETARTAIISSLAVIATTAHIGDFPDVEGDAADGRSTIPIAFPRSSRIFTPLLFLGWSVYMVNMWDLGKISASLCVGLGSLVAGRNWFYCDKVNDKMTYKLHSVSGLLHSSFGHVLINYSYGSLLSTSCP